MIQVTSHSIKSKSMKLDFLTFNEALEFSKGQDFALIGTEGPKGILLAVWNGNYLEVLNRKDLNRVLENEKKVS